MLKFHNSIHKINLIFNQGTKNLSKKLANLITVGSREKHILLLVKINI